MKHSLRQKCPNMEFFLVQIQENTDQKKLCIWTLHEVIYFLIKFDMKKPKQGYFIFLQLKVQPCILQKNITKRIKIKF